MAEILFADLFRAVVL